MSIAKAIHGSYCDHCKMEFGTFDSQLNTWTFRAKYGQKHMINAQAVLTVRSEMSKSKGAVRHFCQIHLEQTQQWVTAKGTEIWPLSEQLSMAKQMEMEFANV